MVVRGDRVNRMIAKWVILALMSLSFWEFSGKGFAWMSKLSLQELTDKASHVVVGKVTSKESLWNPERTKIYTNVTISVHELIKGSLNKGEIVIQYLGGEIPEEDIGMEVSDTAQFSVNQDVLIFLRPHETGKGYKVVGGSQGKYTMKNGIVLEKRLLLDDFRSQIIDLIKSKR